MVIEHVFRDKVSTSKEYGQIRGPTVTGLKNCNTSFLAIGTSLVHHGIQMESTWLYLAVNEVCLSLFLNDSSVSQQGRFTRYRNF
jgi:hypothetical protein